MKFKRSMALIISVVMIFASLTSLVTAATVNDISKHWGEVYIQKLVDEDIIAGYPDGSFKPGNSITRAEFCTMVVKALDKVDLISLVEPKGVFNDVAKDNWAAKYVETASTNKFVEGVGNNNFNPNANITRQEMAKIVSLVYCELNKDKTFEQVQATYKADDYKLADISSASDWAGKYIQVALVTGLMKGDGTNFRPVGQVTRAETATVTYRLLKYDQVTGSPSVSPAATGTPAVTDTPSATVAPTVAPTVVPTEAPTVAPTEAPTVAPTDEPTVAPTDVPTDVPTVPPTDTPTITPTDTPTDSIPPVPSGGPIREHGQQLTIQSGSLQNYPSFTQPPDNGNCPFSLLYDGVCNDHGNVAAGTGACFTCSFDLPEYIFDLGSVQDIQSFGIKGYSTGYQFVYFKMFISEDNESWKELGNEIPLQIGQPIIDDESIYTVDNFDTNTGLMLSGSAPTKFDVSTTDKYFVEGNYTTRTLLSPSGEERDVGVISSPMFDHTLTDVNWAQYGFVNSNCDYMFHYFMDDVQKARYIKIIGYGNSMTQYYMWSSFQEVQVFGPGTASAKS